MRIIAALALAWFFLVAGATAVTTELGYTPTAHVQVSAPLDENDPGWVCWIHGNQRCSLEPLSGPGVR